MTSKLFCRFLKRYNFTSNGQRCVSTYNIVRAKQQQNDQTSGESERKTHFGYESVNEDDKEHKVYEVFHKVADTYDLMNDVMSAGVHRLWKDHFVERLGPTSGLKHIDVAGGTGDIAFRILQYVQNDGEDVNGKDYIKENAVALGNVTAETSDNGESTKPKTHVTVCDINQSMLDVGKTRAEDMGFRKGLSWLQGNAECLPIEDDTYDSYTIAYGIRNCTHVDKVLTEAYRILKPGGRFMCLEFSHVPNPVLRKLYDEYSFQVIPVMGHLIASDWNSYQYLVESIRKFPNQEDFSSMIKEAGFRVVTHENLLFGVSAIHSGFKL